MKKLFFGLIFLFLSSCNTLKLDYDYLSALDKDFKKSFNIEQKNNWHNLDIEIDSIPGMSVERAYSELLNGKVGKNVIVAVIDAGIDITHEDIKDLIWVNHDEIAGNNIDDDKNGYGDDINGWNFLGNSYNETLEMTRIIRDELKDNRRYEKAKETINLKIEDSKKNLEFYNSLVEGFLKAQKDIQGFLGMNSFTEEDLSNIETTDSIIMASKQRIEYFNSIDIDLDYLKEGVDYFSDQLKYHYNVNFNGRSIVGDDIYNIDDIYYGNPNVSHSKKTEDHGTHVAGIIAGIRSNNIGNKGVNNNLEIMSLRAVPNGDEYDKDIALAIKYAVDNGARIINMSFGKSFSSNPEWVIDAIKYAADNDVLIVHAAGNDAEDLDNIEKHNPFHDPLYIQTTTPFVFIKEHVIELINHVEKKENKLFFDFFYDAKKYTEFFFYYAYICFIDKKDDYVFIPRQIDNAIIGPHDPNVHEWNSWKSKCHFIVHDRPSLFSLSSKCVSVLDKEYKDNIKMFYRFRYYNIKVDNLISSILDS